MEDYKGKVVVITGGTTGLGHALADILGERGARVVITARTASKGEAVEAELKEKGYDVKFNLDKVKCNVSLPGVFESEIANSTLRRGDKYHSIAGDGKEMPVSQAHAESGDSGQGRPIFCVRLWA